TAVPGAGTNVPLWILGSSLYGAQLAAMLGLPFAFASHFAPADMTQAIDIYHQRFEPSTQLQEPYVMLGYNVCVADTDEEARYLRSSSLQSFLNLRRGNPGQLPPPKEGFDKNINKQEHAMLAQLSTCSAVGSFATVKKTMIEFIQQTGANELMLVSSIFEHKKRLYSYELAAKVGEQINL
ncbi:MAG: MsnO8 family LLM class oxidoreductase, partial [Pseudomonadales bacterium]|nr:MsnO8 family LLM class oxidoreductase [Pseudomonadales bacterium]